MHQSLLDLQYHKFGNKAGTILTHLCKGQQNATHIAALKDNLGKLATSPKDISASLENFCANLYGPNHIDEAPAQAFLDKVPLSTIDDTHLAQLNAPISKDESVARSNL